MNPFRKTIQLSLRFLLGSLALQSLIANPLTSGHSDRIQVRHYFSEVLHRKIPYTVITPNGEPPEQGWPILFILHGRGRHHQSLIEDDGLRKALILQNFFIVLPSGFDGWYINSPVNQEALYSDSFDELVFNVNSENPVTQDPKKRAIAGWSMGGFGAFYQATRKPQSYGFTAAIIGLVDFPREQGLSEGQNYKVPVETFGKDPNIWRRLNPRLRIDKGYETELFLVIGDYAFDRTMNLNFLQTARSLDLKIETTNLPHAHKFEAVQDGVPLVLEATKRYFESQY